MPTLTWIKQGAARRGMRGPVTLFDITHKQTAPTSRPWALRSRLPGASHWERYHTEKIAQAAAEDVFRNWRKRTYLSALDVRVHDDGMEPRG